MLYNNTSDAESLVNEFFITDHNGFLLDGPVLSEKERQHAMEQYNKGRGKRSRMETVLQR